MHDDMNTRESGGVLIALFLMVLIVAGVVGVGLYFMAMPAQAPQGVGVAGGKPGLGFLEGTWEGPMWGGNFRASYTTGNDGRVISHSQLFKEGKLATYEFEVFEPTGKSWMLKPFPRGKAAAEFTWMGGGPTHAMFDSPDNDYPSRIEYEQLDPNRLVITLSNPHNQDDRQEVFNLKRITP